jgi:hypothetical protein
MSNEKARQSTIRRAFLFTGMEYRDRFIIGRNVTSSLLRENAEFFRQACLQATVFMASLRRELRCGWNIEA